MTKKVQLIGVVFMRSADGDVSKEYLYNDSLGCKVGDRVIVESRDTIAIAKVTAIYVATERANERPIRNVVSKIESEYTRAQERKKAAAEKMANLRKLLVFKIQTADYLTLAEALASTDAEVAETLKELKQLEEQYGTQL